MKTLLIGFALSAFLASTSFASVQIGTYVGKADDGAACSIRTILKSYEHGAPHPLNERVVVLAMNEQFTLVHPPVVDASKAVAHFNHDVLQAAVAISGGAKALVLEMSHQDGADGPIAFHLIEHRWKKDERKAVHCRDLKFVP